MPWSPRMLKGKTAGFLWGGASGEGYIREIEAHALQNVSHQCRFQEKWDVIWSLNQNWGSVELVHLYQKNSPSANYTFHNFYHSLENLVFIQRKAHSWKSFQPIYWKHWMLHPQPQKSLMWDRPPSPLLHLHLTVSRTIRTGEICISRGEPPSYPTYPLPAMSSSHCGGLMNLYLVHLSVVWLSQASVSYYRLAFTLCWLKSPLVSWNYVL